LPAQEIGPFQVVLGYVQVGATSVFSFNQRPAWKELGLAWDAAGTSSVGVAYARRGESKKVYRDATVADALWSFHRLIRLADPSGADRNLWSWTVGDPVTAQPSVVIKFETQLDPFEPFRGLSRLIRQQGGSPRASL
jgi:hypothetical protein